MMGYKIFISGLLQKLNVEAQTEARPILPRPIVEFLQFLNLGPYADESDDEISENLKIARYLEAEVLEGNVETTDDDTFYYIPAGSELRLPMHAASSLVTELSPFILLLKTGIGDTVIFEEPEAHLHLAAQRHLARSLVRLINSGVRTIITTHSDTFLQEINNSMHLFSHPRGRELAIEFGYSENELLDPAKARGYQFETSKEGVYIKEMVKVPQGFVAPIMNQTIQDLSKLAIRLDDTEDEA